MTKAPIADIVYLVPGGPPIHELMRTALPAGLRLVAPDLARPEAVTGALAEAPFVITVKMSAELIAAAPRLRLIQLAGVGYDGVDVLAATRAGVPVAQTVAGTIPGVAEHTVLLMLALVRHLCEADASVRHGEWKVWQLRPTSHTLVGKRVGLVGFGRIAREVARRLRGFDVQLGYFDPVRAPADLEQALDARFLPLDELTAWADVISLHVPLTPATKHLFDEARLARMRPGAFLVNTSRGGLVDETALGRALESGHLGGAGLDVLESEPPRGPHPLFGLPNTVFTPHIATGTRESVIEKTRAAAENVLRVLRGERPAAVINPEVWGAAR